MFSKQKLLQMTNKYGRNHYGGHGHPLLLSTTQERVLLNAILEGKIMITQIPCSAYSNILGLCCYLDQDCRGPPAPNGVVDDRRG